jgi:acetylornithine deacetylase
MNGSPTDILSDLIAFKSLSGQENHNLISYLEDKFKALGFITHRIESPNEPKRYNLLCQIGPNSPHALMLSGHTDVVPVEGQNWDSDPFVLTKKGPRLYGRGTADMKGFIAATLHALGRIKIKKPLSLLWTYDEEIGCQGSYIAASKLKSYLGYLPACALIGEPSEFRILRMHSGHVTVKVSFKGQGAHSSDGSLGISAVKALNEALTGLYELEEELKKEIILPQFFSRPFTSLNVGKISGGTAVNIIPDEAFIILGFRPLPTVLVSKIFERVKLAINKYQSDARVKIEVTIENMTPAMITEENNSLYKLLLPLANQSPIVSAHYSTDGGNLAQAGIPCLIFGPASIDVAHKANEYILESDLDLASDKLVKILNSWPE